MANTAQSVFEPQFKPSLEIPRVQGEIKVDGELDDSGWDQTARALGFAENNPGDQVEPAVHSEAWITYDDNNLYIALLAHDDPAKIRASWSDRDRIFRDDYFGLMIDTYGNQAWGYELFVNPLGIQGDLRVMASGDEDISFDLVWDSRGKVTDSGYQVELSIPFSSLRFPKKDVQTWRANFWRDRQREVRYRYSWAAIDRDNPCGMCQWGYLSGIEGISPSSNLEILPSAIGSQSGEREDRSDPDSRFANVDPEAEAALNLKYTITSSSTAELAINPDFSQVESDVTRIDVNTTFGLFFPERRPFFQEGSDLYDTWISAIYTRTINDPELAAKAAAQFGRFSFTYIFARDVNSPVTAPFEEFSGIDLAGRSTNNILRARQSVLEESYVGGLFTDRRLDDGGSGTVFGVDGLLRFLTNYRIEYQALASHTVEPRDATLDPGIPGYRFDDDRYTSDFDGETYWGRAIYTSLEREARVWNFDFDYWEYSPTFRTDNGFTVRNDYRTASAWTGLFFRPNRRVLINWRPSIGLGKQWSHAGRFKELWIEPGLRLMLTGQTRLDAEYLYNEERFRNVTFKGINRGYVSLRSRYSEKLGGRIRVRYGKTIWRTFSTTPVLGDGFDWRVDIYIRPTSRLRLGSTYRFSRLRYPDEYRQANPGGPRTIFEGYIWRTRLDYQFTREWFLRLIIQYNDFSDRLDIEPLVTYRLNPFTIFYIGSTNRYQYYDRNQFASVSDSQWGLTERQFFAKLQYLFRL